MENVGQSPPDLVWSLVSNNNDLVQALESYRKLPEPRSKQFLIRTSTANFCRLFLVFEVFGGPIKILRGKSLWGQTAGTVRHTIG